MMTDDGINYTPTAKGKKRPSICHTCKAAVVWALLEGKRQPLDYLPAAGGDVALEPELFPRNDGRPELVGARFVGTSTHYRRHIESCPQAKEWREKMRRRGIERARGKGGAAGGRSFTTFKDKKTR